MNFYMLDKNWIFIFVNTNDPGCHDRAIIGQNIWEKYPEIVGTTFQHACLKAFKDQQNAYVELYYPINKSWCEKYIYPSPSGIAVYSNDITEKKRTEKQLKVRKSFRNEEFKIAISNLEKTIDYNLSQLFEQILKMFSPIIKENAKIALPTIDGVTFIKVSDILYCRSSGNYTEIFLNDGKKYLMSRQLKEYEELLKDFNFFRIHHSSLIHIDYMQRYVKGDGGYVVMNDNVSLNVSRRKKSAFLERIGYKPSD